MNQIQELNEFNQACEDFISGKYILVDIKLNSIFNIIDKDEKIKNIVISCLDNYNFDTQFKESVVEQDNEFHIVLPVDDKNVIAYVYFILYKFKNKEWNIYDFMHKYFNANENMNEEFVNFAKSIIAPFKEAVNSIYLKRHVISNSSDYQSNHYNRIMTNIRLIMQNIDNYKLGLNQKEEFTMLLNSLYIASEKNDKKLVYSLMIGLDYFTKSYKKTRPAYLSLEECFS